MKQSLNGIWKMRKVGDVNWVKAKVPGSVYNDLINSGLMNDPFWRENEYDALNICRQNFEYETTFDVDKELLAQDKVFFTFEGLDTLAIITINGNIIAKTNNMHRTYNFDVKNLLKEKNNYIHIVFNSSVNYIEGEYAKDPTWGVPEAVSGISHLRKAHYMFGWDWGPKLPDMGIWRSVYLEGYSIGKIEQIYISQDHKKEYVALDMAILINTWTENCFDCIIEIISPEGNILKKEVRVKNGENHVNFIINNPKLWWPNNYGNQDLYGVKITLVKDNKILDNAYKRIGLRTLTVKQEKDKWGKSFEISVNGLSIFAMGADYIPEDNIIARCNKQKTEQLIKDCIDANMNCIRVWGGGYYPDDYFYDMCDEYGLIVWQDLMFACAVYRMTDEFAENITKETIDNVRRIRHHASLGLWCGNNEMEWGWVEWPHVTKYGSELKSDYIKQFEVILPNIVKKEDPNTFYWKASPSSGGCFYEPNSENMGDVHDWTVWHGLAPFTYFREHYYRFLSEFGLQSFPCMNTIESFTLPNDRNIFSPVMESHQKCDTSNAKILHYISETYRYPKNLGTLIYASQLVQAEGIKYAVEHLRRHRGRCMGAIYWQLNDCWPVASWSSLDYYGKWKALQYEAKRFFSPLLLSACEEETKVELHTTNDKFTDINGTVYWELRTNKDEVLKKDSVDVQVYKLSTKKVIDLDFKEYLNTKEKIRTTYLRFWWIVDGKTISKGTVMFVKAKHFEFVQPEFDIQINEREDAFIISVSSKTFAKYVELDFKEADGKFSDNYFDISGGETVEVTCQKSDFNIPLTIEDVKSQLKIRSVINIYS